MNLTFSPASRPRIQRLDPLLINQIKAGEVIERPAHLLKELLENALDAGATQIKITVKNEGMDLIQVEDNGNGIEESDLALAIERHATSKLSSFRDLSDLNSFGFRGEALASAAAVSKLKIESATKDGSQAVIECEDARVCLQEKVAKKFPHGTIVSVKDLFYNTPARLKFMKSARSERQYFWQILHAFLLSNCDVEFKIQFDQSDLLVYSSSNLQQRLAELWKLSRNSEAMPELKESYDGVSGFLALSPKGEKRCNHKQFIIVNRRIVEDKQLHGILQTHLKNDTKGNRPYALIINLAPAELDSNVHPNKTLVKFHRPQVVHALVVMLVKRLLEKKGLLPEARAQEDENAVPITFQDNSTRPNGTLALGPLSSLSIGEKGPRFFDGEKLLQACWDILFSEGYQTDSTPLLIARPFDFPEICSYDYFLNDLNAVGFYAEKLGENKFVLRAVPKIWFSLPYVGVLSQVIEKVRRERQELRLIKVDENSWPSEQVFTPPSGLWAQLPFGSGDFMKPICKNALRRHLRRCEL